MALYCFRRSNQHCRGAVIDARGIAGRDRAAVAKRGRQLRQFLQRRIGARMFVAIEALRLALLRGQLDRNDFLCQPAGILRRLGPHLRTPGKGILILARNLEGLGDVLRRLRH